MFPVHADWNATDEERLMRGLFDNYHISIRPVSHANDTVQVSLGMIIMQLVGVVRYQTSSRLLEGTIVPQTHFTNQEFILNLSLLIQFFYFSEF